jgi:membrane-bound lytic murein transglycosylase B
MRLPRIFSSEPRLRRVLAASLGWVALVPISFGVAGAQETAEEPSNESTVEQPVGAAAVPDVLLEVTVESSSYQEAVARLSHQRSNLRQADQLFATAEAQIPDLRVAARELAEAIPALAEQASANSKRRELARDDLRRMVVLRYTTEAGGASPLVVFGESSIYFADRRETTLLEAAQAHRRQSFDLADRRYDTATSQLALARDGIGRIEAQLDTAITTSANARAIAESSSAAIPELEQLVSRERRMGMVADTDLSYIALEAYVTAANAQQISDPSCGIRWQVLAGIGRVESRHGTYGNTTLDIAGLTLNKIIGIPLNGESNTAIITDTDGGRLDGDIHFDRAVGPMQFIPSTWAAYARDGDGDANSNPHNLYDAAAAAGAYLCRAGSFTTTEGTRRAIRAYNHSDAYVDAVLEHATRYDAIAVTNGESLN